MIEPGGPRRRGRAALTLPGVEPDVVVVAARRDERRAGAALGELEAEHAAVEAQRALQIGDLEMDVADARPGIDRVRRQRGAAVFRLEVGQHGSLSRVAP